MLNAQKRHKSRGMQIVKERMQVLSNFDNQDIQIEIVDLKNEMDKNDGTLVKIIIMNDAQN